MASSSSTAPLAFDAPDVLDVDPITVQGLQFAAVSFVSPNGQQKADFIGLKIRGAFASKEEAEHHVKRLHAADAAFDIYVVDLYKWLLVPPPRDIECEAKYNDAYLQELVSGYHQSQEQARVEFNQRKQSVMTDGLDAHLLPSERLPPPPDARVRPGQNQEGQNEDEGASVTGSA